MRRLPFKISLYIAILSLIAVALTLVSIYLSLGDLTRLMAVLIFSAAVFVADLYPIRLPTTDNAEVTISCAFKTAAAIIYGPWVAIPAAMIGTMLAELTMKREWYKALFNAAEMTLTTAAMALVFELLHDGSRMPFHSGHNALAVIAMMVTYALINTGLVAGVMALARGISFMWVWRSNFRDSIWNNLTIIPTGAVIAALWLFQPWSIFFLVLPLVVLRKSFQYIAELRNQTRETLIRMADAIDQRDPSTFEHSRRVAEYGAAIAEQVGLPSEDVETIRMAGRLHDLGKIGMSNELLFKPGAFDTRERDKFRAHPQIGADLLKQFRLFEDGQSLVLYHHERFDGQGYPTGLQGEAIPIGSRVLAVADAFDAMTSRRVYREPLSLGDAMQELQAHRGSQFDPAMVDAFVQALALNGTALTHPAAPTESEGPA
jgi:putative nucleotidyltransferase with HDIG domain